MRPGCDASHHGSQSVAPAANLQSLGPHPAGHPAPGPARSARMPPVIFAASTPLISGQNDQGYIHDLLRQYGASEFVARTVQFIVVRPLEIILILVIAWLASRLGARVAKRLLRSLSNRTRLESLSPRASLRVETIGALVASVWRAVVWIIAGLTILGVLGINLPPILAG